MAALGGALAFTQVDGFAPLKQPQLALKPFDQKRLKEVGMKLRSMYPTTDRTRFETTVSPDYLDSLVREVSEGLARRRGRGAPTIPPEAGKRVRHRRAGAGLPAGAGQAPIEPALTHTEASLREGKPEYPPEPGEDRGYEVVNF